MTPEGQVEDDHNEQNNLPPLEPKRHLSIHTRPEIRKGCIWDIHLKISSELIAKEKLQKIFIEKPRGVAGRTAHYLCLKIRSKLIKPPRELPFTKVATIVNDDGIIECNDSGTATLRVRFTARPRAVFHKHSDMMILLVALRKGDGGVLCADSKELVFRGGTGSAHSADQRNPHVVGHGNPLMTTTTHGIPGNIKLCPEEFDQILPDPSWLPPEFDDLDASKFYTDFLQNRGDSLLPTFSAPTSPVIPLIKTFDDASALGTDVPGDLWPSENFTTDFAVPVPPSSLGMSRLLETNCLNTIHNIGNTEVPVLSLSNHPPSIPFEVSKPYTLVHSKRRGMCTKCHSECAFYRGEGGPCSECGCFPSVHLDLDLPPNRKRLVHPEDPDLGGPRPKKPRYLLETKFYQKLFFNCLHFMTFEEIAKVCSTAPVPLFVKDESLVYIYINPTFCSFIMDLAHTESILHKTTSQILTPGEAVDVIKQEKYLMTQKEGTVKTFSVNIQKQTYKVMKQWTVLRDRKRVIVGAVVSSV